MTMPKNNLLKSITIEYLATGDQGNLQVIEQLVGEEVARITAEGRRALLAQIEQDFKALSERNSLSGHDRLTMLTDLIENHRSRGK